MKRILGSALIILIIISQTGMAEASNTLKISYKAEAQNPYGNPDSLYSDTVLRDSAEDSLVKQKMDRAAKSSSTKSKIISVCKSMNLFNGRIKVTDARGGTAGLSNLSSVSTYNIKVAKWFPSIPDYTEAETEELVGEYGDQEYWPEYKEEGYVSYYYTAKCLFRGRVSLIASNSYRIYINGGAGPEYLKSEFAKMNWSITLVDAE